MVTHWTPDLPDPWPLGQILALVSGFGGICLVGYSSHHAQDTTDRFISIMYMSRLTHKLLEMHTQHCGYWWPGAKAPGHQYPLCWLNTHCMRPVLCKNVTFVVNNIRKKKKEIVFYKKWSSCLRVKYLIETAHWALLHIAHWICWTKQAHEMP